MNYLELRDTVRDYLYNRQDLTAAQINSFIRTGEKKIFRLLRCDLNRTTASQALTDVATTITLPDDFAEVVSVAIDGAPCTVLSDLEILHRLESETATGQPTHFARIGTEIVLWPAPGDAYTASLRYYQNLSGALVGDVDTNAVLTDAEDLYIYAAMVEAMPFLAKDERSSLWASYLATGIEMLNSEDTKTQYSGSTNQVSQAQ